MSNVDQEATAEAAQLHSPSPLQAGIGWVAKHWPRVRLAHEGVMLDRVQRVQRIGEISARNAMTGKVDDTSGWPSNEEGDKMGVKIGDEIHHHYAPEPPPEPEPEPTPEPDKVNPLAQLALYTALLFSGAGAVAIPLWLAGNFDREQPVIESPSPVDVDTTRKIEIEVWRP